jgi:3',5'-cyclic AMP phosphodiesterase CpdA
MPIHLGPISRRDFIRRALVVGAGAVLAPELLADSRPVDSNFWALLSDTHLAEDPGHIERGINMTRHFEIVSRELLGLAKRPVGLLLNGDCAFSSGEAGDYSRLGTLLQPLRAAQMPVHLALGNHDNRERFWEAFQEDRLAKRPLVDRQVSLLRTPLVNWFILDSLEKTLSTPGLLGKEQLDWLARTLDENAEKPALVMVHHNPGLDGGNFGLKDTVALLEILRPRRQVKAYIFGHTHNWHTEQDGSGLHLVNLPPVAYVFQPGLPSGWVRADLEQNGMRLELRCVDPAHKAHGQVVSLSWRT